MYLGKLFCQEAEKANHIRLLCQTNLLEFSRQFYKPTPGGRHGGTYRAVHRSVDASGYALHLTRPLPPFRSVINKTRIQRFP